MEITSTAFSTASMALNYYLRLDPESFAKINTLAGRLIAIELQNFPKTKFFIAFTATGIQLLKQATETPDLLIQGPMIALFQLLTDYASSQALISSGKIKLTGDLELASQIQIILRQLKIDWEEFAARYVGDIIAHQLGVTLRNTWQWGQISIHKLRLTLAEYLQEEIRHFPPREEIEDFMHDIDILRNDVERAAARMQRLLNAKVNNSC